MNGLPAGIQGALFSLSNMLIQSSVVQVNNSVCPPGSDYDPIVSGSAAAGNLEGFVYMGMNAVYQGAITFTSQNMGAHKPHRIRRIMYSCFEITTMIGIIMAAVMILFAEPLLALYGVSQTRIIRTSRKACLFRIFRQMRSCSIGIRLRPPSPKSIEKFTLCGA